MYRSFIIALLLCLFSLKSLAKIEVVDHPTCYKPEALDNIKEIKYNYSIRRGGFTLGFFEYVYNNTEGKISVEVYKYDSYYESGFDISDHMLLKPTDVARFKSFIDESGIFDKEFCIKHDGLDFSSDPYITIEYLDGDWSQERNVNENVDEISDGYKKSHNQVIDFIVSEINSLLEVDKDVEDFVNLRSVKEQEAPKPSFLVISPSDDSKKIMSGDGSETEIERYDND